MLLLRLTTILTLDVLVSGSNGGSNEMMIEGGDYAKIEDVPHAAALSIRCAQNHNQMSHFYCGSSILNQRIVLTAGHCLEHCLRSTRIAIGVGSEHKLEGFRTSAVKFKLHPHFQSFPRNDIALIMTKVVLPLGTKVRRIALMKSPPNSKHAKIAGWGLVDIKNHISTNFIKITDQRVTSRRKCINVIRNIPDGVICGESSESSVNPGDSGSALFTHGYIQIGVVSYKVPSISDHIAIYADVRHHYDWIMETIKEFDCE